MKKLILPAVLVLLAIFTSHLSPLMAAEANVDFENENNYDAYAAGNAVNFTSIISSLKQLVSVVLLPIGIVIVGWRIAYLGICCAMAGIDPLNIMGKEGKGVTTSEAVAEIKKHLGDFIHGVLWVGGIWIVFQLALTVAQIFASSLAALT